MRKLILLALAFLPVILFSAYMENLPTQVTQPDGTILNLLASGDEFANRLHDANGYTIIQSKTDGYYYYAQKNGDDLLPSVWRVDSTNPTGRNLTPNLNISEAAYKEKARLSRLHDNPDVRTPQTGNVNNLCVLIRFSDQTEFDIPRSAYEYKFNALGDSVNSQRNYFSKVSNNQLDILTSIYPGSASETNLSYMDSHPRAYYMPYNSVTNPIGYTDENSYEREQILLSNAINAISPQIPTSLNIDADNDNWVDNVCFIIRGPHTAWADLLWGHFSGFYYSETYINGKQVGGYTFQTEDQNEVRTLCHEMFHSIGSPDLYHYNFNGVAPVGSWDIMDCGKGHMGSYMKWAYGGWLPFIEEIWATGDYTLSPISSETGVNCYKINVTGHPNEFFVLEYRKKGSDYFEQFVPDSGLLIYRIYTPETGNAEGPPDEVYLYRPNGTSLINGQVVEAAFSQNNYRTEFNDYTNPNSVWTNNTLAHLNISNISYCGETISFHYANNSTNLPPLVNITSPTDGAVLPAGTLNLTATASAQNATITSVVFYMDENFLGEDNEAPYSLTWTDSTGTPGYHELIVTATASNGLYVSKHSRFRIIDTMQPNWFTWTTDTPFYEPYGRGFLPIQVAVDLDLGLEEYVAKKLAFYITDDPYGDPTVPGMVSATINRFSNGIITSEVLLDIGEIMCPMDGRFEMDIYNPTILNNQIAVVINLFEYQNIMFDMNGISGHSWLTEPLRPWTDALGRGMIGAAEIALQLQNPYVGTEDPVTTVPQLKLTNFPNPFNPSTTLSYNLPKDGNASLVIYNLKGQKVKTLLNGKQTKGNHEFTWKGTDDNGNTVGSGIYLVRLLTNGKARMTRKMVLSK